MRWIALFTFRTTDPRNCVAWPLIRLFCNVDRRDSLKRATEIYLIKEVESLNGGNVRERVSIQYAHVICRVYFHIKT